MLYCQGRWDKMRAIFIILLIISGCISQPPASEELTVLDVEPVVSYYSLGGYTEAVGEAFYVIAGDAGEVTETLNDIVVQQTPVKTTFASGDDLNLVIFRGVFSTGGHGIAIDRVERAGSTFIVYASYTDPGRGMMVTQAFTQPTAIIPIGELLEGSYEAKLKVTRVVKGEKGDEIIEESKEHAGIAFVVK